MTLFNARIVLLAATLGLAHSAMAGQPQNLQYHEIGKATGVGVADSRGNQAAVFSGDNGFDLVIQSNGKQREHSIDFKPTHASFAPGRSLLIAGQLPANQKHPGSANHRAVVVHEDKQWSPSIKVKTWSLAAQADRILFVGETHGAQVAQVFDLDGHLQRELPAGKWHIDNHDHTLTLGPDGKRIAFGGFALKKAAKLYDLESDQTIRINVDNARSRGSQPLVGGNAVVELDDGSILFWHDGESVTRHRPLYKDHHFETVEASPSGNYVAASVSDGYGLNVFDASGEILFQRDPFARVHGKSGDHPQLRKHLPMWQGDQVSPHFLDFEWEGELLSVDIGDAGHWVFDPARKKAVISPDAARHGKLVSIKR